MKRIIVISSILILMLGMILGGYRIIYNDTFKRIDSSRVYLENKGYQIISSEGERNYILKKEQILGLSYSVIWGEQKVRPESYLGKSIYQYTFKIKNHPLDNLSNNKKKQTVATVMIVNDQVIGGYSLPDEFVVGCAYSLEGRTLEEVTGMSLQEWSNNWKKRFK